MRVYLPRRYHGGLLSFAQCDEGVYQCVIKGKVGGLGARRGRVSEVQGTTRVTFPGGALGGGCNVEGHRLGAFVYEGG